MNTRTKALKKNKGRGSRVLQRSGKRFTTDHLPVGVYTLPVL